MRINFVVATNRVGTIGVDGRLPWHLPADLKHFKKLTLNAPIVMGRKTFESIGRPLPQRQNIVLTRDPSFRAEGVEIVHDKPAALKAARAAPQLFVIGGAEIYRLFLDDVDRIYLTRVDSDLKGDTFFPLEWLERFKVTQTESHPKDERHEFAFTFETLEVAE